MKEDAVSISKLDDAMLFEARLIAYCRAPVDKDWDK